MKFAFIFLTASIVISSNLLKAADGSATTQSDYCDCGFEKMDDFQLLWQLINAACQGHNYHVARILQMKPNLVNCIMTTKYDNGLLQNFTPLFCASGRGHLGIVQMLIKANADVSLQPDRFSNTPLMEAAANGHLDVVDLLLQEGADIHATRVTAAKGQKILSSYSLDGNYFKTLKEDQTINIHNIAEGNPELDGMLAAHIAYQKAMAEAQAQVDGSV